MSGMFTVLAVFAAAGLILYLWYHFTRKLAAKNQLLISVCVVVLTWIWEANTAMVLQRVGRYCLNEPMWPPFSGRPVFVPQPVMLVLTLLAVGSLGMALRAFVKFAEEGKQSLV